jgi:hypothetical protein
MRRVHRPLTAVVTLLVSLTLGLSGLSPARADDISTAVASSSAYPADFHPGLIISDDAFYDAGALSTTEIKDVITTRGANCVSTKDRTCLKDLTPSKTVTLTSNQNGNGCKPVTFAEGNRAWTVIGKVAKACSISPKVLLVTIQKEQSGLTQARPQATWDKMMGLGCPDGKPCNPAYAGYEKQLYFGADRLRAYRTWSTYPAIKAFNAQTPYTTLDSHTFVIHNVATASLYQYTPWVSSNYSFFSLMRSYFPGTVNTVAPEAAALPRLTVKEPKSTPIRQAVSVTGTAKDFPGGATVQTQILQDGTWKTSKTVKKVTGSYSLPLTTDASKAGTQSWRVVAKSADGRSTVVPQTFTLKRLAPSLAVKKPKSTPIRQKVSVTGTAKNFADGATVKTQIKVDGKWKTSKTVKKVTGSYSIPLTTSASKAGTQTWRVVATDKAGKSKTTKNFTLKRLKPSLTAKAPKSAKIKKTVKVTGSAKNFADGATVKTQIKVDGKWKTSKTLKKVKGSYSIALTTRASVRGTQNWRVVATSKDGTSKLTKTFTLRRT